MCIEAVSDCSSPSNLGRPSRSRHEPAPRYRARMHTYLWLYTHPRDGRVITNDHFTEAEARRTFPDAEVERYVGVTPIPERFRPAR